MIKQNKSFSVLCDHCGETLITSHDGFSLFVDEENAHESADNEGWYCEEGRDDNPDMYYCKDCHVIDWNDEMHLRIERRKATPCTPSPEIGDKGIAGEMKLDIRRFSSLSAERAEKGFRTYKNVPITYWTTAIAGEVGELCNMIKKMERVSHGGIDGGSSYTAASLSKGDLAEEVGGIFIYLNILSGLLGIDMEEAIIETFNSKSEKYGFDQKYAPAALPTEIPAPGEARKCVCSQEPGDQPGCRYPNCQNRGELPNVPLALGEVPADVMEWIESKKPETHIGFWPFSDWAYGAKSMYNKIMEEMPATENSLASYWFEKARECLVDRNDFKAQLNKSQDQLTEVTKERDNLKEGIEEARNDFAVYKEWYTRELANVTALTKQLSAVQEERDAFRKMLQDFIHTRLDAVRLGMVSEIKDLLKKYPKQ